MTYTAYDAYLDRMEVSMFRGFSRQEIPSHMKWRVYFSRWSNVTKSVTTIHTEQNLLENLIGIIR